MSEVNIFEHAISNVNFVESEKGLLLFIYTTFEVNTNDVRFYIDKDEDKNTFLLHYPSDNMITIAIKNEDTLKKLESTKLLRVFEIDVVDGEIVNYYNATA